MSVGTPQVKAKSIPPLRSARTSTIKEPLDSGLKYKYILCTSGEILLTKLDLTIIESSFRLELMKQIIFIISAMVFMVSVQAQDHLSLEAEDYPSIESRFQTPELNIMSNYCARCHGSGSNLTVQFMLGNENQVLANLRSLKGSIISQIQSEAMPPGRGERANFINSGDATRVLQFVQGL